MSNIKGIFQPKNVIYYTGIKWIGENFDDIKERIPNINMDDSGNLILTSSIGMYNVPIYSWILEEPVGNGMPSKIHVISEEELEEKFNVISHFESESDE